LFVHNCDIGAHNSSHVIFGYFYEIIFYFTSASKYFLQNQDIFLLTEVILV